MKLAGHFFLVKSAYFYVHQIKLELKKRKRKSSLIYTPIISCVCSPVVVIKNLEGIIPYNNCVQLNEMLQSR